MKYRPCFSQEQGERPAALLCTTALAISTEMYIEMGSALHRPKPVDVSMERQAFEYGVRDSLGVRRHARVILYAGGYFARGALGSGTSITAGSESRVGDGVRAHLEGQRR